MSAWRTMVLASGTWRYKIGRGGVRFRSPDRKGYYAPSEKVIGVTPDIFERGQHKRTQDGMVTPSDVRRYIEDVIPVVPVPRRSLRVVIGTALKRLS